MSYRYCPDCLFLWLGYLVDHFLVNIHREKYIGFLAEAGLAEKKSCLLRRRVWLVRRSFGLARLLSRPCPSRPDEGGFLVSQGNSLKFANVHQSDSAVVLLIIVF